MGKKLNPSSIKISKQEEKKQLNNLIKVLRPKVYITDSLSFKKLVQELTGVDEKINPITPPHHVESPPPHHVESPPVIEIQDNIVFPESSFEVSLDSESNCSRKQEIDFPEYRDIESWLLEIDQLQNYDTYAPLAYQEVCMYDYDLSGFI